MARRGLIAALALLAAAPCGGSQLARKRRELARIQGELRRTLQELDSLRASQRGLDQDVSRLQGLDTGARRRLKLLRANLARAESRRAELQSRLDAARRVSGFWSASLTAETARLDASLASGSDFYGRDELWSAEFRRLAVLDKARHLRGLQGFRRRAAADASRARRRAAALDGSRRLAQAERESRRREYEAKKAELAQAQSRVAEAARKAQELEESAEAMNALIERLSRAARRRRRGAPPGRLDLPRRSLPWPARGRIVSGFGREKDPRLGTWIVRQGLLLATAPGASVRAVASGRLIFAGPFRSYGLVAIMDHGGGFFTVYGRLGSILQPKGREIAAGAALARAGSASDGGGRVYLEIRQGTQALDPLDWLMKR